MYTDTRDRRPHAAELKFLVALHVGDAIRLWSRTELTADPHGHGPHGDGYSTTTLYTDTRDQDVYARRGSYGRSKLRIRRYGVSDVVFLERKLRTRTLLSKRRTILPIEELEQLDRLTDSPASADWSGAWFTRRIDARHLGPVCQVAYDRTARVTQTPYGLARLTVDTNLRARTAAGWTFAEPDYAPVLTDQQILELKFTVAMPGVFKRLLETFSLTPDRVSKYRLSARALGLAPVLATADAEVA